MILGFGKRPTPPKDPSEMTEEEWSRWKRQNNRALAILGVGCVLALLVMCQGILGIFQAKREEEMLRRLTDLDTVRVTDSTTLVGRDDPDPKMLAEVDTPAGWAGRQVLGGEKLKLRNEVLAQLRPYRYFGVTGDRLDGGEGYQTLLGKPCRGEMELWQVNDPGVLTESEQALGVAREGAYLLVSLRGDKLERTYFPVIQPDFFHQVLDLVS